MLLQHHGQHEQSGNEHHSGPAEGGHQSGHGGAAVIEQNSGGDCQRQGDGLHGELVLIEQEHDRQQHQHGHENAHDRRSHRVDPAHQERGHAKEQAETQQPLAGRGKARPFPAHGREHNARAERGRADNGHDLKITCDRNDLIDGALDKVLVDEQKVKLCNETGGEERQGAVQVAVILGDARLTPGIVLFCCHLS